MMFKVSTRAMPAIPGGLLLALAFALSCDRRCSAHLLLNAPLDSFAEACQISKDGDHPTRKNCSKALMVSTTCVERWPVEREHLTRTLVPCPAGRPGTCTDFTVRWCENSIYPQKGGCYRSEYAHTGLMNNSEYWFGFSLFLPLNYSVGVDSIHFQVHGNPNKDVHEAHRNPMFALKTNQGNWQMLARGDSRRNITRTNRSYEWYHAVDLGQVRLGQWEHFVYHTRYTFHGDGFLELWRNGKKLVSLTDTGTAYNDDLGPYFKFGIYSASWGTMANPPPAASSTNVLIIGGLKQGDNTSSYAEVDTSHNTRSSIPPLVSPMHDVNFPFFMDIGGLSNTSLTPTVPRVDFGRIFECPHPCGLVSHFDSTGQEINGGIPQEINMTLHLTTLKTTFDRYVAHNESRLMDFDFESWNPVWERNKNTSQVRVQSLARVRRNHPTWTNQTELEAAAKQEFESAAKMVLMQTMAYMRKLRPSLRVGMYGYPTRYYYHGYNTSDGGVLREQNDNLFPLWCSVDAIMPSVYQFYNSCNRSSARAPNEEYVRSNVQEAVRIAKQIQARCGGTRPPVYVYTWHRYHDGVAFVCDQDEEMTWNISAEEGADAVILWGYEPKTAPEFANYWTKDFAPMALAWSPQDMHGKDTVLYSRLK